MLNQPENSMTPIAGNSIVECHPKRSTCVITVVLATHNGEHTLDATLRAFAQLHVPEGHWKLVIVDNNSTDHSASIIQHYMTRLPIQCLTESIRGKNRSLNKAISSVEGECVVFTDDDIIVPPDWLSSFCALADAHPQVSIFGGRITPRWPTNPPQSVIQAVPLGAAFAVHDSDLETGFIEGSFIWGGNMMVRRSLFDAGHRFDESLGPQAGDYHAGGETEFTTRMERQGHQCFFSSDNAVQHIIDAKQFTGPWLAARATRFGRLSFTVDQRRNPGIFKLSSLYCLRLARLAMESVMLATCMYARDSPRKVKYTWAVNFCLGWLKQFSRHRRHAE